MNFTVWGGALTCLCTGTNALSACVFLSAKQFQCLKGHAGGREGGGTERNAHTLYWWQSTGISRMWACVHVLVDSVWALAGRDGRVSVRAGAREAGCARRAESVLARRRNVVSDCGCQSHKRFKSPGECRREVRTAFRSVLIIQL